MKIGYLGPKSSFTHQAAQKIALDAELIAFPSIPKCLLAAEQRLVDFAVVPVENSLEGSVHATIDHLFHKCGLTVVQEIILPIKQQLLTAPTTPIDALTKIMSHPQALAQCQDYLESQFPDVLLEAVASTTYAAEYVSQHPHEKIAAIASMQAAQQYALTVAATAIQDNDFNQTRFWLVASQRNDSSQKIQSSSADKMTILLTLPSNQPGALHKALAAFGWRNIGLSKIESRPLKTSLGEYFFVVDLVCEQSERLIKNALEEIQLLGVVVRNLGAYPVRTIPEE